ncbi:hypothetical protein acdb102_11060 [Acidothermaceae bacterium B102]|nr:hypothetical protein acdb102_11060 [Acidothermaceae bacterium B102]
MNRPASMQRLFLLLPDGTSAPLVVVARRRGLRDRIIVRWRSLALDSQLAAGLSPDDERLRAMRADALVTPKCRRRLAKRYDELAGEARRGPAFPDPRQPLARRRILAAEGELRRLAQALRSPLPVPARGVALASLLLTDGTGPVYNPRSRRSLDEALRDSIRYLDPTVELMSAHRAQ